MTSDLPALLARVEAAPEGSRELDAELFFAAHPEYWVTALETMPAIDVYPRSVSMLAGLPHYTTSLDTALPGENIVRVEYFSHRKQWAAVHSVKPGHGVWAIAHTEPLARRAAALRAMMEAEDG